MIVKELQQMILHIRRQVRKKERKNLFVEIVLFYFILLQLSKELQEFFTGLTATLIPVDTIPINATKVYQGALQRTAKSWSTLLGLLPFCRTTFQEKL
jgi:hypothetical protein